MKKLLQPAFDFLLFSNIFMALCAAAQGMVTFILIGARPSAVVILLLFFSTLGLYNFCILVSKPHQPETSPFRRVRWFFSYEKLMQGITVAAIAALVPLFFFLSAPSRLLLIFLGILSFGYGYPLFRAGNQKFGLRNIPGLKPFLITLVWTLSSVLLPVLEARYTHNTPLSLEDTTTLIAKRFLFIGALTIPFDVRDLFQDRQAGLKTIPVAWGEKRAYLFCQLLLAGYLFLLFTFKHNGFNVDFWALTITVFITGLLIFNARWRKHEYYYFFWLDSVLLLQYVTLFVFHQIFR